MNIRSFLGTAVAVVAFGAAIVPAAHAGTLRWSGDVDDTATIRVSRNDVRTSGNMHGVSNEKHNLRGSLPERPVRVDLRSERGRGDVVLVERPSARNNYTAVIRIKDPSAGKGHYAFTLDWPDRWDRDNNRGRDRDRDDRPGRRG